MRGEFASPVANVTAEREREREREGGIVVIVNPARRASGRALESGKNWPRAARPVVTFRTHETEERLCLNRRLTAVLLRLWITRRGERSIVRGLGRFKWRDKVEVVQPITGADPEAHTI